LYYKVLCIYRQEGSRIFRKILGIESPPRWTGVVEGG